MAALAKQLRDAIDQKKRVTILRPEDIVFNLGLCAAQDAVFVLIQAAGDKDPHAVALGKLGGSVSSRAKSAAARANGKKGGRPRKKAKKP